MKRRTFLASVGAAMAMPAIVRAEDASTLRFIPQVDLTFTDPHFTTAYPTRTHGYMVFDTLYGLDGNLRPSPQMLEGHTVEREGKLWKLTLRTGLLWHDGERVLARDCVASINRWAKRDLFGSALMAVTDELSAPDDRTIQFRLKKPFPLLPNALGKVGSPMCAMMPERLAVTDPFKHVSEIVGSGPFRFVAAERMQGARNVYAKFEKYKPRESGPQEWTAGPKVVHFDRVIWTTIPDQATATAALQNNEQHWLEHATHDLLPLMRRNQNLTVSVIEVTGDLQMMRPNHSHPPFNNPAIRRAVLSAIDQRRFMEAVVGNNPSDYYWPLGYFTPKTPMASEAGLEPLRRPADLETARQALKAAGYAGERVVLMAPSDLSHLKQTGDVAADLLKRLGMNVDYVVTDFGSMLQRRNNTGPVEAGGWSCFVTAWGGMDHVDPAVHQPLRGNGNSPGAWAGSFVSPRMEELRQAWFEAPDLAAQQAICVEMQKLGMEQVPYFPLGAFTFSTATRRDIVGLRKGFAMFWNVRRA
jgi:peptide/nickel transport system substrate-binding protein